jgi:tetratricopeptide (TPR) repeat protein
MNASIGASATDLMDQAVKLARMGEKAQARVLFLQIVEYEPYTLQAWLWLSELADNLQEQTIMLEEALKHMPVGNSKSLQDYLVEIRCSIPLPPPQEALSGSSKPADPHARQENSEEQAQKIIQQVRSLQAYGQGTEALEILNQLAPEDQRSASLWWLASELEPDLDRKIAALQQVVERKPQDLQAAQRLFALESLAGDPLGIVRYFESIHDRQQAIEVCRCLLARESEQAAKKQLSACLGRMERGLSSSAPDTKPVPRLRALARSLFSRS